MRSENIILVLILCISTMHADLVIKKIGDDPTSAFTPSGVMVNTKELKEKNPVDGDNGLTIKYGSEKKCLFGDEDVTIQGVMKGSPTNEDEGLKIHNNDNAYLVDDIGNIYSSKVKQLGMDNGLLHNRVWATYYNESGAKQPIKAVSFYDGFGRKAQTQVKTLSSKWLIDATKFDDKSRPNKKIYSTPDYTLGLFCDTIGNALDNVASDYHKTSVPYTEVEYDKTKPRVKKGHGATEKYARGSGNYVATWSFSIDRNSNIPDYFEESGFIKSSIISNFELDELFEDELRSVLDANISNPQYFLQINRSTNGTFSQKIIDKEGKIHATWIDLIPEDHSLGEVISKTIYDDLGRVKEIHSGDETISPITYQYNDQNQIVEISHPDNGIKKYAYNSLGNLEVITSNPGTTDETVLKLSYDTTGRVSETYITDVNNGIASLILNSRTFFDHVKFSEIPNAREIPFLDEVVNSLNFTRGKTAGSYHYDCYHDTYELSFYSFDKKGRLETSYTYLSNIGWMKNDVEFNFSNNIKSAKSTHFWREANESSEQYFYHYDDEGSFVGFGNETIDTIVSYSYNLTGKLIGKTFYNRDNKKVAKYGVEYNALGAAWKMQMLNSAGNEIYTQKMKYENASDEMVSGIEHNSSYNKDIAHTYSYNEIGQLIGVDTDGDNGELDESFTYDNAGRFKQKSRGGADGHDLKYEYVPGTNKLKKVGTREYSYDLRGNLIHDIEKNVRIKYSFSDMPIEFETAEGIVKMHYDEAGTRYLKEESTLHSRKKTLYLGGSVYTSENDGPYRLVHSSLPMGEGILISYEDELHSYFYAKDHLGSVRGMISNDGTLVGLNHYTAYGEKIIAENAPEMFRYSFLEKELDTDGGDENGDGGLGCYHLDARYYDPVIGVFLSTDPQDVFFNSYAYTGGNPIMYSDPNGESPIVGGLIAGSIFGGVVGGFAAGKDATPAERFVGIFGGAAIGGGIGASIGANSNNLFSSFGKSASNSASNAATLKAPPANSASPLPDIVSLYNRNHMYSHAQLPNAMYTYNNLVQIGIDNGVLAEELPPLYIKQYGKHFYTFYTFTKELKAAKKKKTHYKDREYYMGTTYENPEIHQWVPGIKNQVDVSTVDFSIITVGIHNHGSSTHGRMSGRVELDVYTAYSTPNNPYEVFTPPADGGDFQVAKVRMKMDHFMYEEATDRWYQYWAKKVKWDSKQGRMIYKYYKRRVIGATPYKYVK